MDLSSKVEGAPACLRHACLGGFSTYSPSSSLWSFEDFEPRRMWLAHSSDESSDSSDSDDSDDSYETFSEADSVQPISARVEALHIELGSPVEVLNELEEKGLLEQIPRNDRGEMTSAGSIAHESRKCSPCIFAARGICSKALACNFCHVPHAEKKPSILRRQRRRAASALAVAGPNSMEAHPPPTPEVTA